MARRKGTSGGEWRRERGRHSLSRKTPSPREKVEIFREHLQHAAHIPGQQVLATDFTHPREVIDFLQRKPEFRNNEGLGSTQECPPRGSLFRSPSGDTPKSGGLPEDQLCPRYLVALHFHHPLQ